MANKTEKLLHMPSQNIGESDSRDGADEQSGGADEIFDDEEELLGALENQNPETDLEEFGNLNDDDDAELLDDDDNDFDDEEEALLNSQDPLANNQPTVQSARGKDPFIDRPGLFKRTINRIRGKNRRYDPPTKTLRKLPSRKRRYWAWRYEILRPWEPQPPKNYYKLLHASNPWLNHPPSNFRILVVFLVFLLYSLLCFFLPWLCNLSVLSHRLTVLRTPSWMLPMWFHIFAGILTHILDAVSIWFIYLTGGFRKHIRKMIPWAFMIACEALWPDILFSWRFIGGGTLVCILGWFLCVLTGFLFWKKMGYAGILLLFHNAFVVYQIVVLAHVWHYNGATYSI